MISPPVWTQDQLEKECVAAIAAFRVERVGEPLEKYLDLFDKRQGDVEDLLEHLTDMVDVDSLDDDLIVRVLSDAKLLEAFRYFSGPPVSADDLKTLAETQSLAPATFKKNPAVARAVFQTVLEGLDRRRFPWVSPVEKREPSEAEKNAAIVASAALMAAQRVATDRRTEGAKKQEAAVFTALKEISFTQVGARTIITLDAAPKPGEFCSESMVGGRKADVVVGLHDHRVLAIECKVSNSALNSIKRVKNDAGSKATKWRSEFGTRQIIPSAMLAGVFQASMLVESQELGLTLWWVHDLPTFQKWVKDAKP
jgi:hypothetical protein